jgi:ribosome-associated protein
MLEITDSIRIPEEEFEWTFVRSGGPGGQNVNKVSSKAVMRWHFGNTLSVPEEVKMRFRSKFGSRITTDGELVMTSQKYRDQDRNRQDCLEKLTRLLQLAAVTPTPRRATKPSKASKRRRVADKRRASATKATRRKPTADE